MDRLKYRALKEKDSRLLDVADHLTTEINYLYRYLEIDDGD